MLLFQKNADIFKTVSVLGPPIGMVIEYKILLGKITVWLELSDPTPIRRRPKVKTLFFRFLTFRFGISTSVPVSTKLTQGWVGNLSGFISKLV